MPKGRALIYPAPPDRVERELRGLFASCLGSQDARIVAVGFICEGRLSGNIVDTIVGTQAFGPAYFPPCAASPTAGDSSLRQFLPENTCRIEAFIGRERLDSMGSPVSDSSCATLAAARGASAVRQQCASKVQIHPRHGFVRAGGFPRNSDAYPTCSESRSGSGCGPVGTPVIYLRLTSHAKDLLSAPNFDCMLAQWQINSSAVLSSVASADEGFKASGELPKRPRTMMSSAEKTRAWIQSCDDCFRRAKVWMMLVSDAIVSVDAREARSALNTRLFSELRSVT